MRRFVEELQSALGHWAVVCYNDFDWDTVGIIWRPARFMPAPFKLSSASCTFPITLNAAADASPKKKRVRKADARTHTVPDVAQLLSTVRQLGQGLVKRVEISGCSDNDELGAGGGVLLL